MEMEKLAEQSVSSPILSIMEIHESVRAERLKFLSFLLEIEVLEVKVSRIQYDPLKTYSNFWHSRQAQYLHVIEEKCVQVDGKQGALSIRGEENHKN
jgi:hypothetical protein